MKTRTWTIVLLYPDYIADSFGQDTYLAYTEADDERTALRKAQLQAMNAQPPAHRRTADDFYPLAVFEGVHTDYSWRAGRS